MYWTENKFREWVEEVNRARGIECNKQTIKRVFIPAELCSSTNSSERMINDLIKLGMMDRYVE
jgi:hypothetical protein